MAVAWFWWRRWRSPVRLSLFAVNGLAIGFLGFMVLKALKGKVDKFGWNVAA